MGEYAVSRDVFLRIRDVLVGKCRAFGSASGGGPRRTPGNSTMYIVAENTRPRPCNPHRISPRGCGAAAATRGKTRGNLDRSRGKPPRARNPGYFSGERFFSAPLENGVVPQVRGQPPAIRGEATSPGPRKRPGRPPATPGRPDPGRVARGPRKHVAFAPRGGTFPIVLRIRRTLIASGTIKHVTFAKRDATFSIVSRIPVENDTIPR